MAVTMSEAVRAVNEATQGISLTVITGVGSHQQVVAREFTFDLPLRRLVTSAGHGTMGSGLSMALGAAVSERDRLVVVFDGDGSAAMDIVHFRTAVAWGALNLLVIVLDNGVAGIVRQFEDLRGYGHAATDFYPHDFAAEARAAGWVATTVSDEPSLVATVDGAVAFSQWGPNLIHVRVSDYAVWPILEGGKWLNAMTDDPALLEGER